MSQVHHHKLLVLFFIIFLIPIASAIPIIEVEPPSGTSITTINSSDFWDSLDTPLDITIFVSRTDWTTHNNYPSDCSAGEYVSGLGDTLTCSAPSGADTNESLRFGNLTNTQCPVGQKAIGVYTNGTIWCSTEVATGADTFLGNYSAKDINISVNKSNYWDDLNSPLDISGNEYWYNHSLAVYNWWNGFTQYWYNHSLSIINMNIFDLLSDNVTKWNAINSKLNINDFNTTNDTIYNEALNKYNSSYESCLNNASYLSTINDTYISINNVTANKNWTWAFNFTQNTWDLWHNLWNGSVTNDSYVSITNISVNNIINRNQTIAATTIMNLTGGQLWIALGNASLSTAYSHSQTTTGTIHGLTWANVVSSFTNTNGFTGTISSNALTLNYIENDTQWEKNRTTVALMNNINSTGSINASKVFIYDVLNVMNNTKVKFNVTYIGMGCFYYNGSTMIGENPCTQ